jgi:hypothetical protein
MSRNKKRGLQHKLSDILKPVISLEEKTKYTSQLLSRVAPKEGVSHTSDQQSSVDQQSPVTSQSSIDQQALVSDSHQYHINAQPENLLTMEAPSKKNQETYGISETFIGALSQQNSKDKDTGDQQTPVSNSHLYHTELPSEELLPTKVSSTKTIESTFHSNQDFTDNSSQHKSKDTNDQQTPVSNSHLYNNKLYSEKFLADNLHLTKIQENPFSTNSNNTLISTKEILQKDFKDTGDQQTLVTESPVDQQTPVSNSHQYAEPERNFVKVPNTIFDKLMSLLDPYEFKVYLRLFRLSYGFHKTQCLVGYTSLSQACNLSIRHIKRVIPELEIKGLIKIITTYNAADIKGTLYEVFTGDQQTPVPDSHRRPTVTSDQLSPNKLDDDDFKKTDHHQSEHEKATMMIYQKITENNWTKADQKSYEKVKNVPTEKIELAIRLTKERANNRPNSFAYFVKEILAVANPSQQSRTQRKKSLENIVDRVRTNRVGGSSYSISDLAYDVKEICVREGVMFDHDIFNEVISKNKP